jgi:predicted negative regulator of RcsB-dependent stress response
MNAAQLQQGVDALACYNTAISIIQREGPQCTDAESAAEMHRTMATAYASIAVISCAPTSQAFFAPKLQRVSPLIISVGALHD